MSLHTNPVPPLCSSVDDKNFYVHLHESPLYRTIDLKRNFMNVFLLFFFFSRCFVQYRLRGRRPRPFGTEGRDKDGGDTCGPSTSTTFTHVVTVDPLVDDVEGGGSDVVAEVFRSLHRRNETPDSLTCSPTSREDGGVWDRQDLSVPQPLVPLTHGPGGGRVRAPRSRCPQVRRRTPRPE